MKDAPRSPSSISWPRQLLFTCLICVLSLAVLELGVRLGAYLLFGNSPYFLFYGLKAWSGDDHPEGHTAVRDGYFKFEADRTLHQYGMFKQPTAIRINSVGLRGSDFSPSKSEGTLRVVCLGGSSTFGFYSRDDRTYPAALEQLLRTRRPGLPIEVINAGIPHADSANMLAMLRGELLRYAPDVITVYEAYNDSIELMDANYLQKFLRWMHAHVATYVALKRLISFAGGPELYSRWSRYHSSSRPQVEQQIALHVPRYEQNIRKILSLAEKSGAQVILVKQALNVYTLRTRTAKTYDEKLRLLWQALDRGEALLADEIVFVIHGALITTLEKIAQEQHVMLVDNIAILDEHPEYFASYVHLTEAGNQALARALATEILRMPSLTSLENRHGRRDGRDVRDTRTLQLRSAGRIEGSAMTASPESPRTLSATSEPEVLGTRTRTP
jgi:lysophospholipase L1-like esterase